MTGNAHPGIVLACFLPSLEKTYVIEEMFAAMRSSLVSATVYVGIQHGSHPDTEHILARLAGDWPLRRSRVTEAMHVDSDAAAYVEGLRLLRDSGNRHPTCYFLHTKAITSDNDALRRLLLESLLDTEASSEALARRGVGSFGPHLTISKDRSDVEAMSRWLRMFVRGPVFPVLPYFYVHTVWVAKGECLDTFFARVHESFFSTPISTFSDRYFAESDLPHLVDAVAGLRPSFARLVGNHSTGYRRTRLREFVAHLALWHLLSLPVRAMRLGRRTLTAASQPAP